jgi:hypothetical protein
VIVGDEIVGVVLALQLDELQESAKVIADVQSTRGLYSRQNAHGPFNSIYHSKGDMVLTQHATARECS